MSLNERLISVGAAACTTDTVDVFGDGSGVALYTLDYDSSDESGSYDGTPTNVEFGVGGHINYGAGFNGSSSAIVVPNNILTTNDHSISMWFNLNDTNGIQTVVEFDYENRILFRAVSTDSNLAYIGNSGYFNPGITFSAGQWYHLVITFSAGNPFKIYVDGVLSYTGGNTNIFAQNNDNIIGASNSSGANGVDGKIDQVRVFQSALTSTQVTQLYNETACVYTCTTDTVDYPITNLAYYKLDNSATDETGTYDGTPTDINYTFGRFGQAAVFNGTSAYIDTGGSMVNSLTSITVAGWFYTEPNTNYSYGLNFGQSGLDGDGISISRWNNTAAAGFGAYTLYANIGSASLNGNYTLNENTWYHIAITWTGTTLKFYVNGNLETTATTASLSIPASGNSGYIGRFIANQSYNWKGDIDQVRVFQSALDSTQVTQLYNETACVYTCTTDTVDYPTTNVAYYKLDNTAEDETGTYDGTPTNVNYAFGRFGQAAVFNGSSSKIDINSLATVLDAQSIVTVSFWFKSTSTSLSGLFSYRGSASSAVNMNIYLNRSVTGDIGLDSSTSGAFVLLGTYNGGYNDGNWHHVSSTINYTTGDFNVYVDNTLRITGTNASISRGTATSVQLGANFNNQYFNGDIDQVRIFSSALTSTQVESLYNEKPCADTSTFKTVLYEGNGSTQYVSNVGFEPDLVWIKQRNGSASHSLQDSVRGAGQNYNLYSDNTAYEGQYGIYGYLSSFDTNGFSVAVGSGSHTNANSSTYVAWNWKAEGAAVNIGVNSITGSTPSIASDVSANTAAGFSIVKYTGNGTSGATVGHGLSSPPEIVIYKRLDSTANWIVKSTLLSTDNYLLLNTIDSSASDGGVFWNSTVPSSTLFTLGNSLSVNGSSASYIAYCWHSVAGYSKIGSYSGTGATGNIITGLGFEPVWLMVKRTDSSGNSWLIVDNKRIETNGNKSELFADTSSAESGSGYNITFDSDGFTLNTTTTNANASGGTYIYMAFK
jgi:hypothetical protein